jgi:hypothetical protein
VVSTPAERVKYSPLILAEPARVTKFRALTDYCAWNLHPDVDVIFRYSHDPVSFAKAFGSLD